MTADLHVHTTCSDSTLSPRQVVEECAAQRVGTVAITDHDAVDGIAPACLAGLELHVRVIPGVEMTAYVDKTEIHIVGLFIDPADPPLCEVLRLTREERHSRVNKMVDLLRKLNINITVDDVMKFAGSGAPGRPHVAQALVAVGQVANISEAFQRYIGSRGPAYVPKYQLSPAQAAADIHRAGGAAIIGHPGVGLADALVRQLLADGLDGIEAHHPMHTGQQARHYLEMAAELGVLVSGGSDCHGEIQEGTRIGGVIISDKLVDRIERRAEQIRCG